MTIQSRIEQISIIEYLRYLWNHKLSYFLILLGSCLLAALILIYRPNVYTSKLVLMPVSKGNSSSMLQGLAGQFGGLASMAGVNLGGSGDDESIISRETLAARSFLLDLIKENNLVPEIVAASHFENGKLYHDEELFNQTTQKWNADAFDGAVVPPDSLILASVKSMWSVFHDIENGTVTLSFTHVSPKFSKKFLDLAFVKINELMRARAIERSQRRLEYLIKESETTKIASVRQVLSQLVEAEINKKVLIDTERYYSYEVIDASFIPDKKSGPLRAVIMIFVIIGVTLLFLSVVSLKLLIKRTKNND